MYIFLWLRNGRYQVLECSRNKLNSKIVKLYDGRLRTDIKVIGEESIIIL